MSVYNDLYINGNSEQGPQGSTSAGGRVELLLHCTDLANLDTFTKTDPMCVVFIKQFGQWREYGRTEAVQESLNPKVGFIKFRKDINPLISLEFRIKYLKES